MSNMPEKLSEEYVKNLIDTMIKPWLQNDNALEEEN